MSKKYIFFIMIFLSPINCIAKKISENEDTLEKRCLEINEKIWELREKQIELNFFLHNESFAMAMVSTGAPYFTYRAIKYGPHRAFGNGGGVHMLGAPLHPLNWVFYPITLPVGIIGGGSILGTGKIYKGIRMPFIKSELKKLRNQFNDLDCKTIFEEEKDNSSFISELEEN